MGTGLMPYDLGGQLECLRFTYLECVVRDGFRWPIRMPESPIRGSIHMNRPSQQVAASSERFKIRFMYLFFGKVQELMLTEKNSVLRMKET